MKQVFKEFLHWHGRVQKYLKLMSFLKVVYFIQLFYSEFEIRDNEQKQNGSINQ